MMIHLKPILASRSGAPVCRSTKPATPDRKRGQDFAVVVEKPLWQAGLFALVGVANTVLDFSIYNVLTSHWLGWQRIPANVVSTTVAMTFSFVVNLLWVFSPQRSLVPRRAFRFIWVTCCALYGVQNLVIGLASSIGSVPVDQLATDCQRVLSLGAGHEDLIARNLVKGLATVASMTWNYCWYRFYVFRN